MPPSSRCRPLLPQKRPISTTQRVSPSDFQVPRGSATQVTCAGSPGNDPNPPGGGGQHPASLPTAQLARGSRAWVGHVGGSAAGPPPPGTSSPPLSPPKTLPSPCREPLGRVRPPLPGRHLRLLPRPPRPSSLGLLHASGSRERQLEEEPGTRGEAGRGREGAGWVGREPRGCGLAATLQLAAGTGDGGEAIRLDTHARSQLGTSPGGRQLPLGRRGRAAAVTAPASRGERGARTAWHRGLRPRKGRTQLTVAFWGGAESGGSRLP